MARERKQRTHVKSATSGVHEVLLWQVADANVALGAAMQLTLAWDIAVIHEVHKLCNAYRPSD